MKALRLSGKEASGMPVPVAMPSAAVPLADFFRLLRFRQWSKNLLILTPAFFGGRLLEPQALIPAVTALLSFCLAASAGYLVNDVMDREADRLHPVKRHRPIAAGQVSAPMALIFAGVLFLAAAVYAVKLPPGFWIYLSAYLGLSLGYSVYLKRVFLLDIFAISGCFVLRILAGGTAFAVEVSSWLFLTIFFVSLFLAAGKRLGELLALRRGARVHRPNLYHYSTRFVNGALILTAGCALVTYALYSMEGRAGLFYTVPLATFGMLRYLSLVHNQKQADPTEILLGDGQLFCTLALWAGVVAFVIYG